MLGATQIKIENSRKIKVFISSLEEELACEREFAARAIEEIYLEPEVTVKPVRSEEFLATYRSKEYLHQLKESDLVILILWKGISTPVKEEIEEAERLGKPLLAFVKRADRKERSDQLTSLLERLKMHVQYAPFEKMRDFERYVQNSVKDEITRLFFGAPKTFDTIRSIYEYAAKIISKTQNELYTVERNSMLLLDSHRIFPEHERFHEILDDWMHKQLFPRGSKGRFYSLYSIKQTKEEIDEIRKSGKGNLLDQVEDKLRRYHELQKSTNRRFRIHSVRGKVNPFIVGDNEFGIWFMIGRAQLGISFENREVARKWKDEIEKLTQEQKSLNTMLEELGLA